MTIKKCEDCKCFQRNFMDPCQCGHKNSPKGYSISPDQRPPQWCPLKKEEDARKVDIHY